VWWDVYLDFAKEVYRSSGIRSEQARGIGSRTFIGDEERLYLVFSLIEIELGLPFQQPRAGKLKEEAGSAPFVVSNAFTLLGAFLQPDENVRRYIALLSSPSRAME
jgi:hypothetical protein